MKYQITKQPDAIDIEVSEVAGKETQLLAAFRECQAGRCTCPTNEYAKLDALELDQSPGALRLRLKAREGEAFDQAEIERCLEHTGQRVDPKA